MVFSRNAGPDPQGLVLYGLIDLIGLLFNRGITMAGLVDLLSSNAETTPVSYVLTPLGPDKNGVQQFEQKTPVPASMAEKARATISVKRASVGTPNGVAKVTMQFWLPTTTSVAGSQPVVDYTHFVRVEYILPERGTRQERKNVRALASRLITDNSSVLEAIDDLRPLY